MDANNPYTLPAAAAAELFSPALIIDLDRVRHNVRRVIERCDGDPNRWRPHVKTTKIPRVWAELVRAGLRNFKCATTREAAHLLGLLDEERVQGDVLFAYPLLGPMLTRLGELAHKHSNARVSVLCEAPELVGGIPGDVSIFVDVNPDMDRTGAALDLAEAILAIARAAGPRFRGLHFYDGHLHAAPGAPQRAAVEECYARLMELLAVFEREGIAVEEVITAGTPSFPYAIDYAPLRELGETVHRVSPGTVVLHDVHTEEALPEMGLLPAALVFARIVSHPTERIATCDAGSKAIAAEAGQPIAVALGHPELVGRRPNEEHLPFTVNAGPLPPRGTQLYLFPRHVCPTVNLAEEAVLVEAGEILDIVAVSARAHELR